MHGFDFHKCGHYIYEILACQNVAIIFFSCFIMTSSICNSHWPMMSLRKIPNVQTIYREAASYIWCCIYIVIPYIKKCN